jgi:hypothetical protein
MNHELLNLLGSLALKCGIIMVLIVLACLVTPRMAKWIQKKNPQLADKIERKGLAQPERVEDTATGHSPQENYEVHSAFEASKDENFDPNYKIYNQDIYALNFGKKNKKSDDKQGAVSDGDK